MDLLLLDLVLVLPNVTVGPADPYMVLENKAARLTCEVESETAAEWRFRADSESWTTWGSSRSEEVYSQTPRRARSGSCQARNSEGEIEGVLSIEVHCEFNSLQYYMTHILTSH